MIDLARELGARVLNFFFLVRTGRGESLTDISPEQYEQILTALARIQGLGNAEQRGSGAHSSAFDQPEDPWTVPVGRTGGLIIRAKCAPFFRRILYTLDAKSPLLQNYAHGSCPAGKAYCRIMPEGDITPCPYMPVVAGNLRQQSFVDIWQRAEVFENLREPISAGVAAIVSSPRSAVGAAAGPMLRMVITSRKTRPVATNPASSAAKSSALATSRRLALMPR